MVRIKNHGRGPISRYVESVRTDEVGTDRACPAREASAQCGPRSVLAIGTGRDKLNKCRGDNL